MGKENIQISRVFFPKFAMFQIFFQIEGCHPRIQLTQTWLHPMCIYKDFWTFSGTIKKTQKKLQNVSILTFSCIFDRHRRLEC